MEELPFDLAELRAGRVPASLESSILGAAEMTGEPVDSSPVMARRFLDQLAGLFPAVGETILFRCLLRLDADDLATLQSRQLDRSFLKLLRTKIEAAEAAEAVAASKREAAEALAASKREASEALAASKRDAAEAEERVAEAMRLLSGIRYFFSSSATSYVRAQMVLDSVSVRVASSFQNLIPGVALPDSSVREAPAFEPGGDLEVDLQKALLRFLAATEGRVLEVVDSSESSLSEASDRPDVVLCDRPLFEASGSADKCTWPMACFVMELKVQAFRLTRLANEVSDKPTSWMTPEGLVAFTQLMDRFSQAGRQAQMYGAIVDFQRVMFWQMGFDGAQLSLVHWPATPCSLVGRFAEHGGLSGLEYLRALCCTNSQLLRRCDALPSVLEGMEAVRQALRLPREQRAMLPLVRLRSDRPLLLCVHTNSSAKSAATSVMKLWNVRNHQHGGRAENEARIMRLGVEGLARLAARQQDVLELGDWRGLRLQWHGPLEMGGALKHIAAHAPNVPAWPEVLRIVGLVARGLLGLHEHGYVHSDVKPSNVVLGPVQGGQFSSVTLIDFEHAAQVGATVQGYTSHFCARCLGDHRRAVGRTHVASLMARRVLDWEALFNSVLSVATHEFAYADRIQALEKPGAYWEKQLADVRAAAAEAASVYPGLKRALRPAADRVADFMTAFAGVITSVTGVGFEETALDSTADEELEGQMRTFIIETLSVLP